MFVVGNFSIIATRSREQSLHQRVHTVGAGNREEIWQIRAIRLKSDNYRLIGKADLIESHDGEFIPVEYKRGSKGEWDNDELQVCAQALCSEEMTEKASQILAIYLTHASSHQRQPVAIDLALRQRANRYAPSS
jgi:CRISPR-associated exonuclease Cas4